MIHYKPCRYLFLLCLYFSCLGISHSYAQKFHLPLNLCFNHGVADSLRDLFRKEFVTHGIDTVSSRESVQLYIDEMRKKVREAIQSGNVNERTMSTLRPQFCKLVIKVAGAGNIVEKISWAAYFLPDNYADSSFRHYTVPDSLKTYPGKAIAAGVNQVFRTKPFR